MQPDGTAYNDLSWDQAAAEHLASRNKMVTAEMKLVRLVWYRQSLAGVIALTMCFRSERELFTVAAWLIEEAVGTVGRINEYATAHLALGR
ncbi:hypothetical protein [Nocardia fluminea]|uniref:Uncharacterized protein n=1 Tax=Nocardia fluminea TaxID=134984 RepID=A0A2N3VBD9_9NOCA|nr:hypothetical protein [Nocardia fluminea]PKV78931.1 hypothetical protein ATK86_3316 [Nocardia fluminea]